MTWMANMHVGYLKIHVDYKKGLLPTPGLALFRRLYLTLDVDVDVDVDYK